MDKCQHYTTIAINDSYLLAPWATYHYFCDEKWWKWHKDTNAYKSYRGTRIHHDAVNEDLWRVKGKEGEGLSFASDYIHTGKNSGFQALNIAVLMGAVRIILLGYDMKIASNGLAHWFGDHPDKVRSNYPAWLTNYSIAADQLRERDVEVINCSPDSLLNCFPRMSIESALSLAQVPALQRTS